MKQAEVEGAWQRDRANLKFCRAEKIALSEFYLDRDAAIMQKKR
jgi:hypothetical protein